MALSPFARVQVALAWLALTALSASALRAVEISRGEYPVAKEMPPAFLLSAFGNTPKAARLARGFLQPKTTAFPPGRTFILKKATALAHAAIDRSRSSLPGRRVLSNGRAILGG